MTKQQQQLKKLQKIWYAKLKKLEFDDIEETDIDSLKNWTSSRNYKGAQEGELYGSRTVVREAKEEYYRMAGHFTHEYKFSNENEKNIWILHSEGLSLRDIAAKIESKKYKANKDTIGKIIGLLVVEMFKRYRNNVEQE